MFENHCQIREKLECDGDSTCVHNSKRNSTLKSKLEYLALSHACSLNMLILYKSIE